MTKINLNNNSAIELVAATPKNSGKLQLLSDAVELSLATESHTTTVKIGTEQVSFVAKKINITADSLVFIVEDLLQINFKNQQLILQKNGIHIKSASAGMAADTVSFTAPKINLYT